MEEGSEILQLYEIQYSDLLLLSSSSSSCSHYQEKMIMENLGPTGPGLLAITNVPDASLLRRKLLPLARKLALLSPGDRKRILRDHNLGSDVPLKNPDRNVSSFAMQLKYAQGMEAIESKPSDGVGSHLNLENENMGRIGDIEDDVFDNLENMFKSLGLCMMEIGLCLARICDRAIGGNELEQSLLESCAAKGRLIHYHSMVDSLVLREAGPKKGSSKRNANNHARSKENLLKGANLDTNGNEVRLCEMHPNLWQQWHYDYGIFTLLTDPMFLLTSHRTTAKSEFSNSSDQECASPSGHSYLQVFHPNKNKVLMVKASPESFIVQVGESADILSKGNLRSTLHCVRRPARFENLSRETFVVFLQPAWSKTFSNSDYPMEHYNPSVHHLEQAEEHYFADQDQNALTQEIQKIVPPLSARLKDGMTFAEFSRETTKQYYGGSGLQSNK
ncbi:2-oxoglutarate (2OG) and Fe(II)-dependent oxygenase superfamily protein [Gossypium australe]|uniref:2-oxoglutarate (2OG) and Fe(II)-dependent oxygenase superfamily protein n=1 Tax=Gossypium australe TaxID=47621 RepID=A0A5B6V212_9ROSI|nr:2-oxoglutarate (2OG) and Fe(II)-dependent oxygenase superfamily protein [Gossypium australe]